MTGHPPWPWRRILKLYLAALIMAEGAALPAIGVALSFRWHDWTFAVAFSAVSAISDFAALLLAVSVIGGCVTDQMDYRHEWKP